MCLKKLKSNPRQGSSQLKNNIVVHLLHQIMAFDKIHKSKIFRRFGFRRKHVKLHVKLSLKLSIREAKLKLLVINQRKWVIWSGQSMLLSQYRSNYQSRNQLQHQKQAYVNLRYFRGKLRHHHCKNHHAPHAQAISLVQSRKLCHLLQPLHCPNISKTIRKDSRVFSVREITASSLLIQYQILIK